MQNQTELFVNNVLSFLPSDKEANVEITKRLYQYIRNTIGYGCHLMQLTDDYLNVNNRLKYLNLIAVSPYNNQIVEKFNKLMDDIKNNPTIQYYQQLAEDERAVFEAYLIKQLIDMYDQILKLNMVDQMVKTFGATNQYINNIDTKNLVNEMIKMMNTNIGYVIQFLNQTQVYLNNMNNQGTYCMIL